MFGSGKKGRGRLQIERLLNLERREDGRRPHHVSNIELDPLQKAEPSVMEGRFRSSPDAIRLVKCVVLGARHWWQPELEHVRWRMMVSRPIRAIILLCSPSRCLLWGYDIGTRRIEDDKHKHDPR